LVHTPLDRNPPIRTGPPHHLSWSEADVEGLTAGDDTTLDNGEVESELVERVHVADDERGV
jgi:hypothetical protein